MDTFKGYKERGRFPARQHASLGCRQAGISVRLDVVETRSRPAKLDGRAFPAQLVHFRQAGSLRDLVTSEFIPLEAGHEQRSNRHVTFCNELKWKVFLQ